MRWHQGQAASGCLVGTLQRNVLSQCQFLKGGDELCSIPAAIQAWKFNLGLHAPGYWSIEFQHCSCSSRGDKLSHLPALQCLISLGLLQCRAC